MFVFVRPLLILVGSYVTVVCNDGNCIKLRRACNICVCIELDDKEILQSVSVIYAIFTLKYMFQLCKHICLEGTMNI